MESQEEGTTENGEEECQTQNGGSEEEQEEGDEWADEGMVVDGDIGVDWIGFISGGTEEEEVLTVWRTGEPVTPEHVLLLNSYTRGESAFYKPFKIVCYSCVFNSQQQQLGCSQLLYLLLLSIHIHTAPRRGSILVPFILRVTG